MRKFLMALVLVLLAMAVVGSSVQAGVTTMRECPAPPC